MRTDGRQRGAGLLEAMIAMGVLLVGAAGLVGLQHQSTFFMGDSRRTTRASYVAQDLINQIELWDFDDPRLANKTSLNDADVGDGAGRFQVSETPIADELADHGEDDLDADGKVWSGLPNTELAANGMERYWNVAYLDDYNGNSTLDAIRVAVIIRWKTGGGWRRFVFVTTKINAGDQR